MFDHGPAVDIEQGLVCAHAPALTAGKDNARHV
jgi:hypothetical protein